METIKTVLDNNTGIWIGFLVGAFLAGNFLALQYKRTPYNNSEIAIFILVNCTALGFIIEQLYNINH